MSAEKNMIITVNANCCFRYKGVFQILSFAQTFFFGIVCSNTVYFKNPSPPNFLRLQSTSSHSLKICINKPAMDQQI